MALAPTSVVEVRDSMRARYPDAAAVVKTFMSILIVNTIRDAKSRASLRGYGRVFRRDCV